MKNRINEYRIVNTLPGNAIPVAQYADQLNCNTSNIYKHWRKVIAGKVDVNTLGFEIVLFQNINFIIPLN